MRLYDVLTQIYRHRRSQSLSVVAHIAHVLTRTQREHTEMINAYMPSRHACLSCI